MSAVCGSEVQFDIWAVMLRMTMSVIFGGVLGISQTRKGRAAGFRTYMLVCLGACMTMLLNQYVAAMMSDPWTKELKGMSVMTDVSRFGAQVINGVGFLGAGIVVVTSRQEIKGLTTAAGLWVSACLGLTLGAGFYPCAVVAFLMILLVMWVLPVLETAILEYSRNLNLFVEFTSLDDVGGIIACIQSQGAQIYEVDIACGDKTMNGRNNAVFSIRLNRRCPHARVLAAISEYENITTIDEV